MKERALKAYKGKAPYIFVSYSHKDKATVFSVIDRLIKDGYRVWYDEGITPGARWPDYIADRLKGCTVCLMFASSNWLDSRYCGNEIRVAVDNKKPIIPVKIEDVAFTSGIDFQLGLNQFIEKHKYEIESDFYEDLYESPLMEQCKGSQDGAVSECYHDDAYNPSQSLVKDEHNRRKFNLPMFIALCGILVALIILILILLLGGNDRDVSDADQTDFPKSSDRIIVDSGEPDETEASENSDGSVVSDKTSAPETSSDLPQTTTTAPETTKAPETTETPEVPQDPVVENAYHYNGDIVYEANKLSIKPYYVYWEDDRLVAECYLINGYDYDVYEINIQSLSLSNKSGLIAKGSFDTLMYKRTSNYLAIEANSYATCTLTFIEEDVKLSGVDLTDPDLKCDSDISASNLNKNVLSREDNIKYKQNEILILPKYAYWKDGRFVMECYVTNGYAYKVNEINLSDLAVSNYGGIFVEGSFGIIKDQSTSENLSIEPYSYKTWTLTFGRDAVEIYGADLSFLHCDFKCSVS